MDVDEVRRYLDSTWKEIIGETTSETAAVKAPVSDPGIDRFVNSDQVTLR